MQEFDVDLINYDSSSFSDYTFGVFVFQIFINIEIQLFEKIKISKLDYLTISLYCSKLFT